MAKKRIILKMALEIETGGVSIREIKDNLLDKASRLANSLYQGRGEDISTQGATFSNGRAVLEHWDAKATTVKRQE